MSWYKKANSNNLVSNLATLYALHIIIDSAFSDNQYYKQLRKMYARKVKIELLEQLLEVLRIRAQRICDRIVNHEGSREDDLLESGILKSPQFTWLHEVVYSGDISQYLISIEDYKRFYKQLWSPQINAVYPRGERNNRPWVEAVQVIIDVQNATELDLFSKVDMLKDVLHNVPQSILFLAEDGHDIMSLLNAIASQDSTEIYRKLVGKMNRDDINAYDLRMALLA